MKIRLIVSVILLLFLAKASAQQAPAKSPHWAAGIYGGVSVGYGSFTHPFQKENIVTPYLGFATNGLLFNWDGGMNFRNRFGLRGLFSILTASKLLAHNLQVLATENPGYFVSYSPQNSGNNNRKSVQFALGVSYAFPKQRWCFQPELLLGITEVHADYATAELKQSGTHAARRLQYTPLNTEYKSPTLILGGRTSWHAGNYLGFFVDARILTLWNRVQYKLFTKDLVEQTSTNETLQIKKVAFGAAANLGIFLQIGRWEVKKMAVKER